MLNTLTVCHAIKRCSFGLLFAVLDSPCAQLAGTETNRDCSLFTESCMDEKAKRVGKYVNSEFSHLEGTSLLAQYPIIGEYYGPLLHYDKVRSALWNPADDGAQSWFLHCPISSINFVPA